MNNLFKEFFSKETIVNTLHVILTTNKCESTDPILNFLLQLIKLPVCFALTDIGYAPFRNDTTIIIPYDRMSRLQLFTLHEFAVDMKKSSEYVSSVQMGGGLYFRNTLDIKKYFIDPSLVLFASNVLIRNSVPNVGNKQNISNLIIQRVLSAVNVSRDKVAEAEELSRDFFTSLAVAV